MINDLPFIVVTRRLLRTKVTKIDYKPEIAREVAIINEDDQSLKHAFENEASSSVGNTCMYMDKSSNKQTCMYMDPYFDHKLLCVVKNLL